jgi:hypothetical protein
MLADDRAFTVLAYLTSHSEAQDPQESEGAGYPFEGATVGAFAVWLP